jgi:pyridoxamine 5'-phosphate oxidase-like protein
VTRWQDVVDSELDFAASVQALFDAFKHKTLATLRRDGGPRISGIEAFFENGDLWFGSMWQARKAQDLQRDPRFALHTASVDPPDWAGDAKISGRASEVDDRPRGDGDQGQREGEGRSHWFRAEIDAVVLTKLGQPPDHIVVQLWRPDRPLKRMERR